MKKIKYPYFYWTILFIILWVIFGWWILRSLSVENYDKININTWIDDNSFIVFPDSFSWDIASATVEEHKKNIQPISFIETCDVINTGEFKILEVFKTPNYSPTNPSAYLNYTKQYIITWKIQDAKLCIVADVVNYRKKHQYTYSTYILFSSLEYAGHINVGYSPKNWVIYDYTTSPRESFLDGRFWWDETPKIYNLNLERVIVANPEDKGWKPISPLKRLQQQWPIRIGWFVNAKNWEGIIQKFVIAYKCEDWSDCKIE